MAYLSCAEENCEKHLGNRGEIVYCLRLYFRLKAVRGSSRLIARSLPPKGNATVNICLQPEPQPHKHLRVTCTALVSMLKGSSCWLSAWGRLLKTKVPTIHILEPQASQNIRCRQLCVPDIGSQTPYMQSHAVSVRRSKAAETCIFDILAKACGMRRLDERFPGGIWGRSWRKPRARIICRIVLYCNH